ncbi:GntR family transcriptional regulator [Xylophilus sp. GOD-11R]|uniref:GntR family transcriptional regulator n=1 Tax=Xylophilus sp. GOD-11R TaxID=3089814 RepID=UPI00298C9E1E|nr:GntR family transcriptional regulator [Xylophilus sp. GOD-11R]WPB55155.1 GntR family transcriptional regulator [Xylophilus sp. GOD-11R]
MAESPLFTPIAAARIAASPASPAFASIEMPDLVGVIEARLQEAILSGSLAPGSRIVEAELARQMGVSRAPVREAARRLESLGLLVSRPRHGFAVRTISVKEVDDLYQVRINLELMSAALACRNATDEELANVGLKVDEMVAKADVLDQSARVALDLSFHVHICQLSRNEYLQRLFENMMTEVRMFLALSEETYGDRHALAETHRPIALALAARDIPTVQNALRYHLEVAQEHVRGLFLQKG